MKLILLSREEMARTLERLASEIVERHGEDMDRLLLVGIQRRGGDLARRLTDSVETAANLSGGLVILNELDGDRDTMFSQNYACEECGVSLPELSPRMFSFNNPYGACPVCTGLGTQLVADPALIIPDDSKSILQGAIQASGYNNVKDDSIARMYFEALGKKYHFSLTEPIRDLPKTALDAILYGTGKENLTIYYERANGRGVLERPFEGVLNNISRRYTETQSEAMTRSWRNAWRSARVPNAAAGV